MSDQVESGLEGEEGTDESQVSAVSPDEATSSISPDLSDAQIEAVIASPNFEKLIQRHTSKVMSNLEKRVDDLSQLDRYQKLTKDEGLSHDAAKERIKLQDDIAWLKKERGESVGSEPTGEPAPERASSIDYIEAYEKAGMKTPDSSEEFAWAAQFETTVALKNALVEKKANLPAEKEASPGTAVSPSGGKSPTKIDEAALNAEFNSLTGKPMDMLLDSGETVRARRAEIAKLVG